MKTQIGQFKGKPTITLNPGAKYPFSFGPDKARLIVENIDEIRAFVTSLGTAPVKVSFTHPNGGKGISQYPDRAGAEAGIAQLRAAGFIAEIEGMVNGHAGALADSAGAAGVERLTAGMKAIAAHVNGNH